MPQQSDGQPGSSSHQTAFRTDIINTVVAYFGGRRERFRLYKLCCRRVRIKLSCTKRTAKLRTRCESIHSLVECRVQIWRQLLCPELSKMDTDFVVVYLIFIKLKASLELYKCKTYYRRAPVINFIRAIRDLHLTNLVFYAIPI